MFILRHGDARRERPADARAGHFLGGHAFGPFDQLGIVRGAQPDVMGKNDRAINVVVAMHRVNAVEQGNLQAGLPRLGLEAADQVQPCAGRIPVRRIGIAAAQHRTQKIVFDVRLVCQRRGIHLHQLADFFIQGHLGQQGFGLFLDVIRAAGRGRDRAKSEGAAAEQK
jgi:hypothetical protein